MTEPIVPGLQDELRHIPRSALTEFLWKQWGLQTHPEVAATTVGVAATRILRNNPNRINWTVVNHSGSIVYLGFSPEISVGSGFYLSPSGGTIQAKALDDGALVIDEIWAISGVAGLSVAVIETVIDAMRKG